ncbi:MAG: GntR family transcriptional regulator [Vulcanimicrobiaceae bacterium]
MPNVVRSPVPLYFQVANDLEAKIASGAYAAGTQLPNEKKLTGEYGVSIVTVRAAMRTLLDKRLVVRFPGKGTFVASPGDGKRPWSIGSLDEMITAGRDSELQLVWRRKVFPPPPVAAALNIDRRTSSVAMRTIRRVDGEAFMVTDTFHPPHIARRLRNRDFTSVDARSQIVIEIVEQTCGVAVDSIHQAIGIEMATKELATLLHVPAGTPLLVAEREYHAHDGQLVQVTRAHYRTDHFRYVMTLSRRQDADETTSFSEFERRRKKTPAA